MNKIRVIKNITSTFYQHDGVRNQRVGISNPMYGPFVHLWDKAAILG